MEAFEIELLLGVPIGLFVYSTKIRDLVAYEPPEYAPATALGSIFLLLLLVMVALQRSYLGQRLYRTVTRPRIQHQSDQSRPLALADIFGGVL